jgi:ATP phosphoribosyltransferase regulatory subunit
MSSLQASLLPVGLYDQLPPFAEAESRALSQLLRSFTDYGYAQVSPPLLEFEDTLLSGRGSNLSAHTFRIMDPLSHRMLGLRADMTMQIARIASDRLSDAPRPLRLCYAGQTLRVQGESLRQRRQFRQAGIELISSGTLPDSADGEVMSVALTALLRLGIADLCIDINAPGLVRQLLDEAALKPQAREVLEHSISQKDVTGVEESTLSDAVKTTLKALIASAGSATHALPRLRAIALNGDAANQRDRLCAEVEALQQLWPTLAISVDAVEARGFEYHHGISFSLFAAQSQTELGRGGRYILEDGSTDAGVEATGFTIYVDALQTLLPLPAPRRKVLICGIASTEALTAMHSAGDQTILAGTQIADEKQARAHAQAEGCSHFWLNHHISAL